MKTTLKTFTMKITWLPFTNHGWGNGYVVIPEGHPAHGKDYDDIHVSVHGGLTFSALVDEKLLTELADDGVLTKEEIGSWVVGFDTAHFNDTLSNWPKEHVEAETGRLKEQLENYTE